MSSHHFLVDESLFSDEMDTDTNSFRFEQYSNARNVSSVNNATDTLRNLPPSGSASGSSSINALPAGFWDMPQYVSAEMTKRINIICSTSRRISDAKYRLEKLKVSLPHSIAIQNRLQVTQWCEETLKKKIDLFFKDCNAKLNELATAAATSDISGLEKHCAKLKGELFEFIRNEATRRSDHFANSVSQNAANNVDSNNQPDAPKRPRTESSTSLLITSWTNICNQALVNQISKLEFDLDNERSAKQQSFNNKKQAEQRFAELPPDEKISQAVERKVNLILAKKLKSLNVSNGSSKGKTSGINSASSSSASRSHSKVKSNHDRRSARGRAHSSQSKNLNNRRPSRNNRNRSGSVSQSRNSSKMRSTSRRKQGGRGGNISARPNKRR